MSAREFRTFSGEGRAGTGEPGIPPPPPWRRFTPEGPYAVTPPFDRDKKSWAKIQDTNVVDMVNAAIALRRPLLVTGGPGSGKSTLAEIIAAELSLGRVLHWPITSSSRLQSALYEYDAIGRVHAENQHAAMEKRLAAQRRSRTGPADGAQVPPDIGDFIRLGPLGTALLPWERPRVLLIDEIDKSDIDLPNDLLHVFERGDFYIRELARLRDGDRPVNVLTDDRAEPVAIKGGHVQCHEFPIVLLTSNQERSFPAAFLRRCLRLDMKPPTGTQLREILDNQIGDLPDADRAKVESVTALFETELAKPGTRATDQVLNAVFLVSSTNIGESSSRNVRDALFKDLEGPVS